MKVFLNSISSLPGPVYMSSCYSNIRSSHLSVLLGYCSLVLLSQADNYCRKLALISRLGLLELMNSKPFSKVHLNFIIKYIESTQHALDWPLTE